MSQNMPPFSQYEGMIPHTQEEATMMKYPSQSEPLTPLDVTISVGFLKGIMTYETNKKDMKKFVVTNKKHSPRDLYDEDLPKVVVTVLQSDNVKQIGSNLTSLPIECPEELGRWKNFTAMFPMQGDNKTNTSITLPRLIRQTQTQSVRKDIDAYKPEVVEFLISLVYENEIISLGKASVLVTGEEVRTRQSDLPIDITRDGVMRCLKKTNFSVTKCPPTNREGELVTATFKHDRRSRKYQISREAVLRIFVKATSSRRPMSAHRSRPMLNDMSVGNPHNMIHQGYGQVPGHAPTLNRVMSYGSVGGNSFAHIFPPQPQPHLSLNRVTSFTGEPMNPQIMTPPFSPNQRSHAPIYSSDSSVYQGSVSSSTRRSNSVPPNLSSAAMSPQAIHNHHPPNFFRGPPRPMTPMGASRIPPPSQLNIPMRFSSGASIASHGSFGSFQGEGSADDYSKASPMSVRQPMVHRSPSPYQQRYDYAMQRNDYGPTRRVQPPQQPIMTNSNYYPMYY